MLVADGLGGLPLEPGGKTELETAKTPNLDELAALGVQGASIPVAPGISPGSGPGPSGTVWLRSAEVRHRPGALEATGIGFELQPDDVAVRCNFCTLDAQGHISDRRAGRIASDESAALVVKLRAVKIPGVQVFVEPVKEHRFVVVFRAAGLGANVRDTDPQATGVPPLDPVAAAMPPASGRPMWPRSFSPRRDESWPAIRRPTSRRCAALPRSRPCPRYEEVYGLRAAAIAVYPMYKGLARLVGMEIVGQAQTLDEQIDVLEKHWNDFDFFFMHFKYTDSTGEDGNFDGKVQRIEELDAAIPRIIQRRPQVLIVTGDHSTPAFLKSHSWHPVPTLLVSDCCRPDGLQSFGESNSIRGGLGQFEAKHLMTLALANAGRLGKYGA